MDYSCRLSVDGDALRSTVVALYRGSLCPAVDGSGFYYKGLYELMIIIQNDFSNHP